METIYISGHLNPDTDSICSSIAYSAFKNKVENANYIPLRLGNVNNETKFILNYFKIDEPMFLDTLRLKLSDLDYNKIPSLNQNITIKKASEILKLNQMDSISITDNNSKLIGILTLNKLNEFYSNIEDTNILSNSNTSLDNIIEALDAEVLNRSENRNIFNEIKIAASSIEDIKNIITKNDVVIVGNRMDVIDELISKEVAAIILTNNTQISLDLLNKIKVNNISIIKVKYNTFVTSRLIYFSIPVSYIMITDNLISFNITDLVEDVKKKSMNLEYIHYPILDEEKRVIGMISKYDLMVKNNKKIIQLDHNELTQAIDGIEQANVLEIIDHHKMNISTKEPISVRFETVGSTCTIISKIYFENKVEIEPRIAGVLMSGIISDTLLFKSPTCTSEDIEICKRLAEIANINDIDKYGYELLKASTSLDGKTVEEIFNTDFKTFEIGSKKIGVSQINTMDKDGFYQMKDEMLTYMTNMCEKNKYNVLLLVLTDIINNGSTIISVGPDSFITEIAFNEKLIENELYKEKIVSRKKQVIPMITDAIEGNG